MYHIVAFLLVIFGAAYGKVIFEDGIKVSDVSDLISAGANTAMAIAAYAALSGWKKQHKYVEKYKRLGDLYVLYDEICKSIEEYIEKVSEIPGGTLEPGSEKCIAEYDDFIVCLRKYTNEWVRIKYFLHDFEYSDVCIDVDSISSKRMEYVKRLMESQPDDRSKVRAACRTKLKSVRLAGLARIEHLRHG